MANTRSVPTALTGPVGRALIELALPDGPKNLSPIRRAVEQGLLSELSAEVVTHRLDAPFVEAASSVGTTVPAGHVERNTQDRVARLRVVAALGQLGKGLDEANIPWVVIKGPAVSSRMPHPHHRSFNDLDLLVDGPSFGAAITTLVEMGAAELNQNWQAYLDYEVGEVPMRFGGIPVDLHWTLVGLGIWRRTMRLDVGAMLRRRRPMRIGEVTGSGLDPTDALLHLCLHAGMSGAVRLDQLRDVAIGATADVAWEDLVRRATEAEIAPLIGFTLDRARNILRAAVPAEIPVALAGRMLKLGHLIDGRGDPRRPALRGGHIVSARNGATSRARSLRVLAAERLAERRGHRGGWDFADPTSALFQDRVTGDAKTRDAFLSLAGSA